MAETTRLQQLLDAKLSLIAYLKAKTALADWHAVSDCANDLRELDVELKHTPVVFGGVQCNEGIINPIRGY